MFSGFSRILPIERVLVVEEIVDRNSAGLRIIGGTAEEQVCIDVAGRGGAVGLEIVRSLQSLAAGLTVAIPGPIEAELQLMGADYFAKVIIDGGIRLQAAESPAIEAAAEDYLLVIAGKAVSSSAPTDEIRDLDALGAEETRYVEAQSRRVDGRGIGGGHRVDKAGVGKHRFVGQRRTEDVSEVGHDHVGSGGRDERRRIGKLPSWGPPEFNGMDIGFILASIGDGQLGIFATRV